MILSLKGKAILIKVIFLNLSLLLFINACSTKNFPPFEDDTHTAESRELYLIMNKLEFVTDNDIRTQLDYDDARRRYALHISDTLLDIVSRIQNIPEDELAKSIDKSKKKLFYKYLKQLQVDAKDIEQLAQKYELEKLPNKLEDVHITCNNCHSHLRKHP